MKPIRKPSGKSTCDLHVHSTASDGSLTPTQVIESACALGLGAIALTDHNTTSGLREFSQAAASCGIPACCGVEFTTEFDGTELHLLGLFLPEESWDVIEEHVSAYCKVKQQSNQDIIRRLAEDGYPVSYEELLCCFPNTNQNRSHIAQLLLKKGVVNSMNEAFETLLQPNGRYYKGIPRPSFLDTISHIKNWGGIPIWAHPYASVSADIVERIAMQGKSRGLVGLETHYVTYSWEERVRAILVAKRIGLLESGGSDFHGTGKPDIALGTGKGSLSVPLYLFHELRAAATENSTANENALPKATHQTAGQRKKPTREAIHKCMQGNKRSNTTPELVVRERLRKAGLTGYRLQWKAPGRPDIAWPGKKIAIQVNGCFWHRCPRCKPSMPKSNIEYWSVKFDRNVKRDRENLEALKKDGWTVHVIWECQLRKNEIDTTFDDLLPILANELGKNLLDPDSKANESGSKS